MSQYLFLLHDDPSEYIGLSPEELQRIVEQYSAWARSAAAKGLLKGSNKLRDEGGRVVRTEQGRIVVRDGFYAEAKEIVGGYFIIEAPSYDAAVEIAKECPHARSRGRIEVREIEHVH